jgi:hypothetical protein
MNKTLFKSKSWPNIHNSIHENAIVIYESIVSIGCDNIISDKKTILNIIKENNEYYIIINYNNKISFKQLITDINYLSDTKNIIKITAKYYKNAPMISIYFNETIEYLTFKHSIIILKNTLKNN